MKGTMPFAYMDAQDVRNTYGSKASPTFVQIVTIWMAGIYSLFMFVLTLTLFCARFFNLDVACSIGTTVRVMPNRKFSIFHCCQDLKGCMRATNGGELSSILTKDPEGFTAVQTFLMGVYINGSDVARADVNIF